jgi:hypothetical protein
MGGVYASGRGPAQAGSEQGEELGGNLLVVCAILALRVPVLIFRPDR